MESKRSCAKEEYEVLKREYRAILGYDQRTRAATDLKALHVRIHQRQEENALVALCLSGGGIRSATFCLGVLQALAKPPEDYRSSGEQQSNSPRAPDLEGHERSGADRTQLERIHYLSTVSGGGYIGACLSALFARRGPDTAVPDLFATPAATRDRSQGKFDPTGWLRDHSSYLAPKRGWSADTWGMVALYLRHLLINWLALIPFVLAVLALPLLHLLALQYGAAEPPGMLRTLVCEGVLYLLVAGALLQRDRAAHAYFDVLVVALGLASAGVAAWHFPAGLDIPASRQPLYVAMGFVPAALLAQWSVATLMIVAVKSRPFLRERLMRDGGRILSFAVAWSALHALVYFLPSAILQAGAGLIIALIAAGGVAGVVAALGGYWSRVSGFRRQRLRDRFSRLFLNLAAAVFIVFFVGVLGALANISLLRAISPPSLQDTGDGERSHGASIDNYVLTRQAVCQRWRELGKSDEALKDCPEARKLVGSAPDASQSSDRQRARQQLQKHADKQVDEAAREVFQGVNTGFGRSLLGMEGALLRAAEGYRRGLKELPLHVAIMFVALAGFAALWMRTIGVNTFSLTTFYEKRLARAYLGASRKHKDGEEQQPTSGPDPLERRPDPYTGFDPNDDLPLSALNRRYKGYRGPYHVIGAALNISQGKLRWQQRKAASFTLTPLHSGSWVLGFQRTARYAAGRGRLSLGRAMAISGAAVSPNMGYHTSPLIAFVLTFFNARLGVWLPNPAKADARLWRRSEPKLAQLPLLSELAGRTDYEKPFVYVSDGGHFDNLGLYEMIRRRCHRIVVIDAGADPDYRYDDLSSVLAKIRADMNVEIQFRNGPEPGRPPRYLFYTAEIIYPDDEVPCGHGELMYVKATMDAGASLDVRRYARNHSLDGDRFPHQSTSNQFFDEDQFESYRALGFYIMRRVLEAVGPLDHPKIHNPVEIRPLAPETPFGPPVDAAAAAVAPAPASSRDSGMPPLAALHSWSALGVLGAGLTVGGLVGVAGSVALAPGGTVSLAPGTTLPVELPSNIRLNADNVKLAPGSQVELAPGARVQLSPDSQVQLAPGSEVGIRAPLPASPQLERLDKSVTTLNSSQDSLRTQTSVLAESNRALERTLREIRPQVPSKPGQQPLSDRQLNSIAEILGRIDGKLGTIQQHTKESVDNMKGVQTELRSVQTTIGPRRSVIEGREGAR
jgi:hypothetical protein